MSQTVFGAEAVVTFLNRAFNNTAPGNLIFQNQVAAAGTSSAGQYAFAAQFGQSFSSLSDADLATKVLGNMGVLPNADLVTALTDYFASVGNDARGIVVLQLGQILANLEGATGDLAIFAPAATAWNNEVTLSFEYSTNPANTATVDPLLDMVKPVATAPTATVNYNENQVADAVLATVTASDNVSVTGFEISEGNDAGFFAISADGKITLTTAGLASTANDADDTGAAAANTFTLKVKAVDAAGNKSDAVEVKLEVKDVDDTAPTLTSAVIVGTTATLTFNEDLQGSPAVADFKVKIAGGAGEVTINKVEVQGKSLVLTLASAPSAGQSYTVDYTGTSLTDKAATPNALAAIAAAALVTDVTAPTFAAGQTISYKEGFADDAADVLGTVVATDATGVSTFSIVSGNTEGFFAISNEGKLTLTAAGLAGAANDFETLPNSFTLGIKATDGAGNATTQNVSVTVTNNTADDAAAPLELALTNQTDAKAGESGDDTFIGDNASVQAADVIDGNGGKDTARLTFAPAADATYILTSREVETFKLQNASTADQVVFNAINVTELENLTNNNSTSTLTVTNVSANVAIGVVGGNTAAPADLKVTYQSGKNTGTAKINLEAA
ncbi:SwmB domain-containing protein, partial [Giesbergeria sinuosa]